MENHPIQKRKNLKRKGALDDFKLEPIDNADPAPDVKIEVFEIEGSHNTVGTHEEMIIEEIGTADVKIEVLEINPAKQKAKKMNLKTKKLPKSNKVQFTKNSMRQKDQLLKKRLNFISQLE